MNRPIDYAALPDPDEAYELRCSERSVSDYAVSALSVADEVGLFDALAHAPATAAQLAAHLGLHEAPLAALCRLLVAQGELLRQAEGLFALPSFARQVWLSESPLYRGFEYWRFRDSYAHGRILEALQEGWSPLQDGEQCFTESWSNGQLSTHCALGFTEVMHSMVLSPALATVRSGAFSAVRHLVDVGGGSGALAAAFLAHYPGRRATVFDLDTVCEASAQILSKVASAAQLEYYPRDFFRDEWLSGADALILSNILHDWPVATCRVLLGRAHAALAPGGSLFIREALLDEGGCAPLFTVTFDLLMHINHRAQQFTLQQLSGLLVEAGFEAPMVRHRFGHYALLQAVKPAQR